MLFSKKSQAIYLDLSDHTVTVARASSASRPAQIEEIRSCPAADANAVSGLLREIQPKRGGSSGYIHANCGVYTTRRIVRRATLDPKRFKEPEYLSEVVSAQFRIEPDKYTLAALNANTGADFDLESGSDKEAIFAGMPSEEISSIQKRLLEMGVYPSRLEIGTLATLGAIVDYLSFASVKTPTLVLEIDAEATQAFILSESGVDTSRPIAQGLDAMIPAVQKELGLKDEESARKLFYSNTFDFTGMGPVLVKRLIKELQSSIGFYEVQTGQSIGQVLCTLLPPKMGWLQGAIAGQLGVGVLDLNLKPWLEARGISFGAAVARTEIDPRSLGLFSLMLSHDHAVASQEKS